MPIEPDPEICRGAPRIGGTRLTVYNVVLKLWLEPDEAAVTEDYGLPVSDVEEARRYCAALRCIGDKRRVRFCSNCVLDEVEPLVRRDPAFVKEVLDHGAEALEGHVARSVLDDPYGRGWDMARAGAGAGAARR